MRPAIPPILYVSAVLFLSACTVTDEVTQKLDVQEPKFSVAVNGSTAYTTLLAGWQPPTCPNGTVPPFTSNLPNPPPYPSFAVPVEEAPGVAPYPIEISVAAVDASGIDAITVITPSGSIEPGTGQITVSPGAGINSVQESYSAPNSGEAMDFQYSRMGTSNTYFLVQVSDGANSANVDGVNLQIAPESELCN